MPRAGKLPELAAVIHTYLVSMFTDTAVAVHSEVARELGSTMVVY